MTKAATLETLPAVETPAPSGFAMGRDSFAFANETIWHHPDRAETRKRERFSRYCFVMTRSSLQFYRFARFDPDLSWDAVPREELAHRVRQVARLPLYGPDRERIVFPGENLFEASEQDPLIFQQNIGRAWTTYTRLGNWRIILPVSTAHQVRTFDTLLESLRAGIPRPLWLINFPSLDINHAVVAFAIAHESPEDIVFHVYDPNYSGSARELRYNPVTRSFRYCSTFYFDGGPVKVRILYRHACS